MEYEPGSPYPLPVVGFEAAQALMIESNLRGWPAILEEAPLSLGAENPNLNNFLIYQQTDLAPELVQIRNVGAVITHELLDKQGRRDAKDFRRYSLPVLEQSPDILAAELKQDIFESGMHKEAYFQMMLDRLAAENGAILAILTRDLFPDLQPGSLERINLCTSATLVHEMLYRGALK